MSTSGHLSQGRLSPISGSSPQTIPTSFHNHHFEKVPAASTGSTKPFDRVAVIPKAKVVPARTLLRNKTPFLFGTKDLQRIARQTCRVAVYQRITSGQLGVAHPQHTAHSQHAKRTASSPLAIARQPVNAKPISLGGKTTRRSRLAWYRWPLDPETAKWQAHPTATGILAYPRNRRRRPANDGWP